MRENGLNMIKNKNGNNVLDRIDESELVDYVIENFYDQIRDYVMDNEMDNGRE